MKIFSNFFAAAATIFIAAVSISSLLAQETKTKQYYATMEKDSTDGVVLYIRGYDQKPGTSDIVQYVQDKELSNINCTESGLLELTGLNTFSKWGLKRAVLDVDENFKPSSTARWFKTLAFLDTIEGLEKLNTENVTDMSGMFSECVRLKSLDLSNFNTESVKNMKGMFEECKTLESLDLSSFKTDSVTNMRSMFEHCEALTNLDLRNFNTENVTNMGYMFTSCKSLTSLDLSGFNTANVTKMDLMLHEVNLDIYIRNFNGEKVTDATWFKKLFVGSGSKVGENEDIKQKVIVVKEEGDTKIGFLPTKTKYRVGEPLDLSGGYISINVKYDNAAGEEESLDIKLFSLEALEYTVKGFDNISVGVKTVSVEYGGVEYSFEVEVEGELKEVLVVSEPSRNEYTVGLTIDSLNLSGGVIQKIYKDTTLEEKFDTVLLKMEDYEFEVDLAGIKLGENTLVLKFNLGDTTFEWNYVITVAEPTAAEDLLGSAGSGVGSAFEAWASGGVLSVKAVRGGVLEVLGVNGVLVRRISVVAGGSVSLALGKGVYVLRMGVEVKKVAVE